MHYSKDALRKMAQEAAEQFLVDEVPMTDSISKVSSAKDLNREQLSRVCAYANHAVNAELMKKQAYTTFELADPDAIWPKDKEGGFFLVPAPADKTAFDKTAKSVSEAPSVLDTFQELASAYRVPLVVMGDADRDARNLLKAADLLSAAAFADLTKIANALEQEGEDLYTKVKEALLSGVSMEEIARDMAEDGSERELEAIWPRLEAEFLVPASTYDDDGPFSMQRAYKQADIQQAQRASASITWERGDAFRKVAERVADLDQQARLSLGALRFCEKVAGLYSDQGFVTTPGPYHTMASEIEKRAVHPVTSLVGRGLGKALAAPFKAIGRGIKGGVQGAIKHRKAVKDWKNLPVAQRLMTDKPTTKIQRVGKTIKKHPVSAATAAFTAPEVAGALKEVNKTPRIIPL